jgi:iron complex outermembrane receptor protein
VMYGFEAGWKLLTSRYLEHNLTVSYTYGNNQVLDEPLPEIPPMEFRYQLIGKLFKNKLVPEIQLRQALKQDRIALSYGETKTPGFNVVDFKLKWLGTKNLSAVAGIRNLFDTAYYEHLARSIRSVETRPIYSPGRSYYVTLTLNFM